ncbi:hypothetical protein GIB67_021205 [Kingdonia uniflora]|uniref:Cinnamyl alcohol dehydrogenase n=1 Tax=Kingdonia uniflora TaxID=39325 RepID=A0A7J7LFS8_9MAGN|nr:hypothetical protein GIB67_021205 [Kingdonia uniflora]
MGKTDSDKGGLGYEEHLPKAKTPQITKFIKITASTSVPKHNMYVFKIPDNYLSISAAPLLCAGITVYAPMMRHKMNEPSKFLGVIGIGGLGHLAVKFGKAFGLHSSARSLDFIIDTASGDHPFDSYMALLKPSGVLVLVGFPSEVKFNPMSLLAASNIHPEVEVILIQYMNEVLERMENRDVKYRFVIDIKNSLK